MSIGAAKRAIAALLLPKPTTPEGAVGVDGVFKDLTAEGHKQSDLSAALFELSDAGLVHLREQVDRHQPRGVLADLPPDVFATPIERPPAVEYRYQVVWPLPPLRDWWKAQAEPPAPSLTNTKRIAKRDKNTEARDKWIYDECCKLTPHAAIVVKLKKKIAGGCPWRAVSTKQRVQQIGNEYADSHGLERPSPRQNL